MEISPGLSILNAVNPPPGQFGPAFGTIGGFVYKGSTPFLLTCFHCIENAALNFDDFVPDETNDTAATLLTDQTRVPIGTIIDARMTITTAQDPNDPAVSKNINLDIALIEPNIAANTLNFNIPVNQAVTGSRILLDSDKGSVNVFKYGNKTFGTSGTFIGISTINITYPPRPEIRYFNRVVMVSGGSHAFAEGGDSGAFILDENNAVVGVLFLADAPNKIAYGICPDLIEQALGVTFKPPTLT
jgi:hypothetical protein